MSVYWHISKLSVFKITTKKGIYLRNVISDLGRGWVESLQVLLIDLADALKEVIDQSCDVMLAKSAKISKISAKTHLHAIIDRFVVRVRTSLGLASWLNEKDSVRRHFFFSGKGRLRYN